MSKTIDVIQHHMGPPKLTPAASVKTRPAVRSGTFAIGSDLPVHRLSFGAMQLTGPGVWGEPADRAQAIAVLRRAVELGINLIDTADSYGPYVSEELIHEALHPYLQGVVIATKAGLTRPGPGKWVPLGRPDYLRQECEMSLRRLGVERIDLFQLHRIDPNIPADDQFGALNDLQQEGKVHHVGLSEVGVAEIKAARRIVPIATVQNQYNLVYRNSADVLDYCTHVKIGFSLVPARDRRSRETRRRARKSGQETRRKAGASGARVAAQEISRDAPDPRDIQGETPRGERRRRSDRTRRFQYGGIGKAVSDFSPIVIG